MFSMANWPHFTGKSTICGHPLGSTTRRLFLFTVGYPSTKASWNAEQVPGLLFFPPNHLALEFFCFKNECLVEEANDLASNVLATGLLVIHDTGRGGEHHVAELTSREQLDNPLLELGKADVVARRDDTALVEAANTIY